MTPLRRALVALGIAGVVAGAGAMALILSSRHNDAQVGTLVFGLLIGWSLIGTGLFAWGRRPGNNFGPLMTAVGFAWFGGALTTSNLPGVFITGALFGALPIGILIHLLIAFPAGRWRRT